ncbi:MAG TPA: N-acetylmuramic acid 6-phosphate etherase [Thermoanaerobaculia bacterium]|nr:N-acetylmuramic acid 6-phosphate etherase [Thermoanaerobaculia bacterium]
MSDTLAFLERLHAKESEAVARVGEALEAVARASDALAARLEAGGRWLYAGAGTSGRLAALDAAELPPTFGTDPHLVVALLAGGPDAMRRAVEGAEDDEAAAARDLAAEGLSAKDAVVAVSASGATPYALGALRAARAKGALTVAVSCTKGAPLLALAEHPILVEAGPEVVAGSTRLSAGTVQKVVLNMLSTSVMRTRGLVVAGEMAALRPTNAKLRARAIRIVSELASLPPARAEELLHESGWSVPVALVSGTLGLPPERARERLEEARGNVARALARDE